MVQLSREILEGLPRTGATDPIEFYRKPLVGGLFRRRINMGLELLGDRRFARGLEIGYGAGAVLLSLAPAVTELHGIDLDASPEAVRTVLASKGHAAELVQGSVYDLPYGDGHFDLVVSFSVFEHLPDYPQALREVARVLGPGGHFLLGMPAVNRFMEAGFRFIGFKGIAHHHVTRPADVRGRFAASGLRPVASRTLDVPIPGAIPVYHTWLLERSA